MKAYVIATGAAFALLVVAHIWRAMVEGATLAQDPTFIIATVVSGIFVIWAWRVFRLIPRSIQPKSTSGK